MINVEKLEKQAVEYEQQAEMMLANHHRLKGAALAIRELLKPDPPVEAPKEAPAEVAADAVVEKP